MKLTRRTCLNALLGTMLPDLYAAAQGTDATVVDETWTDTARGRTLPLKLRWPDAVVHGEPHPVLLFSHGLGGTREGGAVWGARTGPQQALWCCTCNTPVATWRPFAV